MNRLFARLCFALGLALSVAVGARALAHAPRVLLDGPPPFERDNGWTRHESDGSKLNANIQISFVVSGFMEYRYTVRMNNEIVETGSVYQIVNDTWNMKSDTSTQGGAVLVWNEEGGYYDVHTPPQYDDWRLVPN